MPVALQVGMVPSSVKQMVAPGVSLAETVKSLFDDVEVGFSVGGGRVPASGCVIVYVALAATESVHPGAEAIAMTVVVFVIAIGLMNNRLVLFGVVPLIV